MVKYHILLSEFNNKFNTILSRKNLEEKFALLYKNSDTKRL